MDWVRVNLSFFVAFCLCSPTYSQLEIKAGVRTRVDASGFTTIGDRIYLDAGATVGGTPVGLIRVITEASNVEVEVSDVNRVPYAARKVDKEYYEIDQPGKWFIDVTAIDFAKSLYGRKSTVLELGVGPGPGPAPTPPEPGPSPSQDAPIEGDGLRVLIVFESHDAPKLSAGHQSVMYSEKVRSFLNENCVKASDGTAEWRLLDADTPFQDTQNKWAKALSRPRSSLPWLLISNGKTGYEGPLPEHVEEMVLLVDQFAGVSKKVETSVTMLKPSFVCPWCDKFLNEEARKLTVAFKPEYGVATKYPAFVVRHNGRTKTLEGFHTADQIHNELKKLGGK